MGTDFFAFLYGPFGVFSVYGGLSAGAGEGRGGGGTGRGGRRADGAVREVWFRHLAQTYRYIHECTLLHVGSINVRTKVHLRFLNESAKPSRRNPNVNQLAPAKTPLNHSQRGSKLHDLELSITNSV